MILSPARARAQSSFAADESASYVRRASHAGQWYTSDEAELDRQLESWMRAADGAAAPSRCRAVIAPHAGLSYSGRVAAFAYRRLSALAWFA